MFCGYFSAAYVALFLCFSSVVFIESAHHDNTRYFRVSNSDAFKSSCFNDSQYEWLYIIGRPITAEIECQVFKRTRSLSDLAEMRVLVIGVIAAATAALGLILVGVGLHWITALAIAIAVFTLPGMQNAAFMTNFPNAIAPLFALLSFITFAPVRPIWPLLWKRCEVIRSGLAIALLILTTLIYPALSFVFFWGSVARALTDSNDRWARHVKFFMRDTIMFGLAMLTGLLLSNAFQSRLASIPDSFQPDFSISAIVGKVPFLFNEVIPYAANLWFIPNGYLGYILIGSLLVSSIIIVIDHIRQSGEGRSTLKPIAFAVLLLAFTFAPLMLSKLPLLHQRVLFPGMGALVLIAVFVIPRAFKRIFPTFYSIESWAARYGAVALAGIGLVIANYTQLQNVLNTNYEMMFVRGELAKYQSLPRRIHLIRSINNNTGFNGLLSVTDEFNRKTTDFNQDIVDFIKVSIYGSTRSVGVPTTLCDPAATNCEMVVPQSHTIISFSDYGASFCRTNGMVVVDLNVLVRATHTGTPDLRDVNSLPYCDSEKYHISTDSQSDDNYSVGKAFDNSFAPPDFWETSIAKPVTLDISYETAIALEGYSLSGGESSERMPVNWVLYGSEDSKVWKLIDAREKEPQWRQNENRLYKLAHPTSFKYFRFVFKTSNDSKILRIYEIKLNELAGELKR